MGSLPNLIAIDAYDAARHVGASEREIPIPVWPPASARHRSPRSASTPTIRIRNSVGPRRQSESPRLGDRECQNK
jgi:hypothetical protein